MPVRCTKKNGKVTCKYGKKGKAYHGKNAWKKAAAQGEAIKRSGYKEKK